MCRPINIRNGNHLWIIQKCETSIGKAGMENHVCVIQKSEMGDQVRGGRQHPYTTELTCLTSEMGSQGWVIVVGKPSWRN